MESDLSFPTWALHLHIQGLFKVMSFKTVETVELVQSLRRQSCEGTDMREFWYLQRDPLQSWPSLKWCGDNNVKPEKSYFGLRLDIISSGIIFRFHRQT